MLRRAVIPCDHCGTLRSLRYRFKTCIKRHPAISGESVSVFEDLFCWGLKAVTQGTLRNAMGAKNQLYLI